MHDKTIPTDASKQYQAAYAEHYTTKDLYVALKLYRGVMAAHPNTKEAEYSRMQILNIANSVVPKQEVLTAQIDMALAHLERGESLPLSPLESATIV